MKKDPPEEQIFREHPALGDGEEEHIARHITNAMILVEWLKTNPGLRDLKVAAIVEATSRRRFNVLDRILGRIFKVEKTLAYEKLVALKNE